MAALVRVDNPMGAEIEPASPLADVEAALARGGVTPDQASEAMKAMGKLLDERDEKVRAEVDRLVTKEAGFKTRERIVRIAVLDGEFTVEDGTLTRTLKLKRNEILEKYETVIDGLFE